MLVAQFYQSVAGTLALSGTTSVGCANYLTDKSSTYTARSVTDAAYVTGKTSAILSCLTTNYICSANNGLNKAGNNVRLGGALTGATTINGALELLYCATNKWYSLAFIK